mgnify:CR=1 FL=1
MGHKDPSRKPARRAPHKPKIDDELIELARVLDEQRLDKNAAGWFSVPWRDGWNAVQLAFEIGAGPADSEWTASMSRWINERTRSAQAYFEAGDFLERLRGGVLDPFARAALRCYQLLVAQSDAGGEGYNRILFPLFDAHPPERFDLAVLHWRARDALGGFVDERRRAAFNTAWRRGLYRAAYAV